MTFLTKQEYDKQFASLTRSNQRPSNTINSFGVAVKWTDSFAQIREVHKDLGSKKETFVFDLLYVPGKSKALVKIVVTGCGFSLSGKGFSYAVYLDFPVEKPFAELEDIRSWVLENIKKSFSGSLN